jgi:tetratricopeptide (TPR) repeat protein
MRDFRLFLRLILPLFFLASGIGGILPACHADEPPADLPQTLDGEIPENLLPLSEQNKTSPEEKQRIEAAAHFMQGIMLERRGEFQEAMQQYQQAIQIDPNAIEAYRSLIMLSIRFNQPRAALSLLVEAIKHAPTDFQLLTMLGQIHTNLGQLPQAIQAFEQASESPEIEKGSAKHVLLMAQLAKLYRKDDLPTKAADAYKVVFEVLSAPEEAGRNPKIIDVLQSDPDLSYDTAGVVFLEDKRYDLALEAFELAAKNPRLKAEEIGYYKAEIFQAQGKPEQALAALQPYLDKKMQSRGVAPYQLLAGILKSQNREDEIESTFDQLYEQDPTNNFVVYALADLYRQQDQNEKAIDLYLKAIGRGADPEGYKGLMDVYYSQGKATEWLGALSGLLGLGKNVDGIEEQFKQVSEDTEFMDKLVVAAREQKEAGSRKFNFPEAYIIGRLSAASKRTDYVVEFYKMAMEFRPTQRPQLTGELAQYLMDEEEHERTVALMEEALKLPGQNRFRSIYTRILLQALWDLSYDLEEAGAPQAALEKIRRAEELSNEKRFVYRRGLLEYRMDHIETAISILSSLIEGVDYASLDKNTPMYFIVKQSRFLLSAIHVQKGRFAEGEKLLLVVYENEPNDPGVNNDLGYLYADQNKNLEQAEKMIRLALQAEPENNAYLDSMAWVLYRRQKYDEALKYMLKAVEGSEEGDATLWDHLGDIYEKRGQVDKAVESWQTALKHAEKDDRRDEALIGKIRRKLGLSVETQPLSAPRPASAAR